jgi:hypothetical protein
MAPFDGIRGDSPSIRPATTEQPRETERPGQPGGGVSPGIGRARRAKKRGKAGDKTGIGVGRGLGVDVGEVDAYEDDGEEQRKRRRANWVVGEDEPVIMNPSNGRSGDRLAAIAPEFRPQMVARMAAANSMVSGTTMVNRGKGGDGDDESKR